MALAIIFSEVNCDIDNDIDCDFLLQKSVPFKALDKNVCTVKTGTTFLWVNNAIIIDTSRQHKILPRSVPKPNDLPQIYLCCQKPWRIEMKKIGKWSFAITLNCPQIDFVFLNCCRLWNRWKTCVDDKSQIKFIVLIDNPGFKAPVTLDYG